MPTEIENIISSIVNIPIEFHRTGNKSWNTLLELSGYYNNFRQISEGQIESYLKEHPSIIEHWLFWSDDNRNSPSWYFQKIDKAKYFVGYYPDTLGEKSSTFTNQFAACAHFIMREIEASRLQLKL